MIQPLVHRPKWNRSALRPKGQVALPEFFELAIGEGFLVLLVFDVNELVDIGLGALATGLPDEYRRGRWSSRSLYLEPVESALLGQHGLFAPWRDDARPLHSKGELAPVLGHAPHRDQLMRRALSLVRIGDLDGDCLPILEHSEPRDGPAPSLTPPGASELLQMKR